jgi:hypothetical protein
MVFTKIVFVGVAIAALMIVAKDHHWAQRAGVTGTCYATQAYPRGAPGGAWYACKQGILTSFPNLEAEGCDSMGIVLHREIWQCQGPLVSLPSY